MGAELVYWGAVERLEASCVNCERCRTTWAPVLRLRLWRWPWSADGGGARNRGASAVWGPVILVFVVVVEDFVVLGRT